MPTLETLTIVALASLALVIVPGPAVIYILTRSVSQGRAAGLASAAGVNLGSAIHVLAAVAGLSFVLAGSATLFNAVRWAGIAYLAWLGIRALTQSDVEFIAASTTPTGLRRVFGQGVVVNVLNPKVAVFFLAFLPQFIDPNDPNAALQSLVLGMTLVVIGLISDSVYALIGGSIGDLFRRRPGAARATKRAAGLTYLALAGFAAVTGARRLS
ncbi:MAG: LysE family translocator [Acidimicrobiia bacterium]|nr:LysE family translocator [Acidimicrobiia bacterium]